MSDILTKVKKYRWPIMVVFVMLFAFARLFFKVGLDSFYFLDEYITFDAAAGFMHTGEFKLWDFHTASLSDIPYIRAWPHTVLLGLWFKIFGVNVVAGRILSCIFGMIAVASWLYITYKIYDNVFISFFSCVFYLANTDVVTNFRLVRMYALWMPLMMWLFYFAYLVMVRYPEECDKGPETSFIKKIESRLGFSLKYIIAAILALFLSYSTHVDSLAAGAGFALFYIYMMITKREKRYIIALGIIIVAITVICLVPLNALAALKEMFYIGIINLTVREDPNIQYYEWIVEFVRNRAFFFVSFAGTIVYVFWNKLPHLKYIKAESDSKVSSDSDITLDSFQFTIYSYFIIISSILVFLYFVKQYYQARYMIYVAPLVSLIMAIGIYGWGRLIAELITNKYKNAKKETVDICVIVVIGLICVAVFGKNMLHYYYDVYSSIEIPRHKNVYEIIKEDASAEIPGNIIPIVGYDIRDNYAVEIFDEYVTKEFDRKTDMNTFMEFAALYPDGYMTVETSKINGFSEGIKPFIFEYSERLTGRDIDTNAIETVRYHMLKKRSTERSDSRKQNELIGYKNVSKGGDGTTVSISVNTGFLSDRDSVIFLVFDVITESGDSDKRCCQLAVDKTSGEDDYYIYDFHIPYDCKDIKLEKHWVYEL